MLRRLAITLSGTDAGRSGLGTYIRETLPELRRELADAGAELIAFGTRTDLEAYRAPLGDAARIQLPSLVDHPAAGAAWHLQLIDGLARRAGADVLLLPAANRRCTYHARIPTVAVVHDLAQLHVDAKYDRGRMLYARRVVPAALATATRVVAVSEATRADVLAHVELPADRVRVVLNGVDAGRFAAAAADQDARRRARAAAGVDGPYLLYLARLEHPGKNHLRLLEAYAASVRDRVTLVLAGADWGAGAAIRAEIDRLGLSERVRVLGFVDGALVPGLVAEAHAVVMVGLHEGFGLPALEALAAGRPVAAATTGALPEVVGDLGALCDPYAPASIASAITRCVDDDGLRARAAEAGPVHAATRSWARTARGLFDACVGALR